MYIIYYSNTCLPYFVSLWRVYAKNSYSSYLKFNFNILNSFRCDASLSPITSSLIPFLNPITVPLFRSRLQHGLCWFLEPCFWMVLLWSISVLSPFSVTPTFYYFCVLACEVSCLQFEAFQKTTSFQITPNNSFLASWLLWMDISP